MRVVSFTDRSFRAREIVYQKANDWRAQNPGVQVKKTVASEEPKEVPLAFCEQQIEFSLTIFYEEE